MPVAGPYYLAYINKPDPAALRNRTAFDPGVHNVMDEYVFSYRLIETEGDKPILELVIRNPHIGLLNDSREQWAWFSRDSESTSGIEPLFCGRLIAAPTETYKELMTVRLVAWPTDFPFQKQKLAEEIKASGPYEPAFIDVTKRDDPDTILEAVSGLWHIDPVTHVVSISDILNGEDGNVDITANDHLDKGLDWRFDQTSALTNILMVATVNWNQTGQGFVDMGARSIETYAGDALIAEWPKPLSSLGGGYTVAYASAVDASGVSSAVTASAQNSWTNREKEHSDGDQLTWNFSESRPIGFASSLSALLTYEAQPGLLDPFATDGDGDPSPTNIPEHGNASYAYVPLWTVNTSLGLFYRDLDRQRTERVQMLLKSDLQAIIYDPQVEQNSEVIVKTATDVGIPIVNLLNWTTVAGTYVDVGTIVFPDNPSLPSQRTAQIATIAGTAGLTPPAFSDVPGETTQDGGTGGVTWASLGTPAPTETAFDWTANTPIGLGTIIMPRKPLYLSWSALTQAGRQQFPRVGTQISRGTLVSAAGGFHVCTLPGLSGLAEPGFGSSRGVTVTDGSAQWTCLGASLPDGKTHFVAVQAGRTGGDFLIPQFENALHSQTTDNTVIWASIGPGVIPAGGTPGDVWARSFFTTERGNKALEYLISILRARGRMKARAVTLDCEPARPFGLGAQLSLRKTATVHSPRLGGGVATGKLIAIERACEGRTGRETCKAQLGCAVGKDNVIEAAAGDVTYVDGYVQGYRESTNVVKVISDDSDVGYTPPAFVANDDGLTFPLDKGQIVISEGVRGDLSAQAAAVQQALRNMAAAAALGQLPANNLSTSAKIQQKIRDLSAFNVSVATALNPIWYDAVLKPLSGWQFNNSINVKLTKLTTQRGYDLEAASNA